MTARPTTTDGPEGPPSRRFFTRKPRDDLARSLGERSAIPAFVCRTFVRYPYSELL